MYGAILGDMIGAPYEFDRSPKIKDFPLFSVGTEFTDDSVMTIAVAEALLNTAGKTDDEIRSALISSMRKWGKRYPGAGYGGTDTPPILDTRGSAPETMFPVLPSSYPASGGGSPLFPDCSR